MDVNFYKTLLSFRTHSKSETQIIFRDWLRNHVETNYENVKTDIDTYGNLYVMKGDAETVNCVVAHLDINQRTKSDNIYIARVDDWILGIDKDTGLQIGLGHDDKAGVYFALQALKKFDNLKVFFPLDEEIGCVGTKNCEPVFFENVGFMVQLDRRGYKDVSSYTNGNDVLTKESQDEFKPILDRFGYDYARCIATDVGYLVGVLDIQGVNISCGYYDEHSDKEVLNVHDYDNAERFALSLLKYTNGRKFEIQQKKYTPPTYGNNSYSGGGSANNNRSSTNSSVGSHLSVVRPTNANSHLIKQETTPNPREERPIDTYDREPFYVNSADLFQDENAGLGGVPVVEMTLEDKTKDFQFNWHSGDLDLLSIQDPDVLTHGYKQVINFLIKETTKPDEEVISILEDLMIEVEEVERLGRHDLTEVKNFIIQQKQMLKAWIAEQKR